jgi:regulator of extracellular matrix RemA (YlzA/DUF370 family)
MTGMFLSVGYGGFVSVPKILAIGPSDSSPMRKRRKEAKDKGLLIDFTKGSPVRGILVVENHELVLSAFQPETLVSRINEEFPFLSVGYGGFVAVPKILAIGPSDSSPMRKRRKEAKDKGFLIDFRKGRPARGILTVENHELVLSAFQPETLVSRANKLLAKIRKGHDETSFMEEIPVLKKSKN